MYKPGVIFRHNTKDRGVQPTSIRSIRRADGEVEISITMAREDGSDYICNDYTLSYTLPPDDANRFGRALCVEDD